MSEKSTLQLTFNMMLDELFKEAYSIRETTLMTRGRLESFNRFQIDKEQPDLKENFTEDNETLMERLRSLQRALREISRESNRNHDFLVQNIG